jgi:hypothetical protein
MSRRTGTRSRRSWRRWMERNDFGRTLDSTEGGGSASGGTMTLWLDLTRLAAAANVGLPFGLARVWIPSYRAGGARHTLAFLVFAGFLLVENLLWLYLYVLHGWVCRLVHCVRTDRPSRDGYPVWAGVPRTFVSGVHHLAVSKSYPHFPAPPPDFRRFSHREAPVYRRRWPVYPGYTDTVTPR